MKKKLRMLLVVCVLAMLFAACGNSGGATVPTPTVEPTSAPSLEPTATFTPTSTPEPTATSTPTSIPEPTATSTPIPEPPVTVVPTPETMPEDVYTYQKGVLTSTGFTSEWLNLTYTTPDEIMMANQNDLDDVMGIAREKNSVIESGEKFDYTKLANVTEMWSGSNPYNSVKVLVIELSEDMNAATAEECLEQLMAVGTQHSTMEIDFGKVTSQNFAGEEYACVDTTTYINARVWQRGEMLVRVKENRMIQISFACRDGQAEILELLKAGFSSYTGPAEEVLPPERGNYKRGTITEQIYKSDWANLTYVAPSNAQIGIREEVDDAMGTSADSQEDRYVDGTQEMVTEIDSQMANIGILTEQLKFDSMTAEQFLWYMAESFRDSQDTAYYVDDTVDTYEIQGAEYRTLVIGTERSSGDVICQIYFARTIEDRAIVIVLSWLEGYEEDAMRLLDGFEEANTQTSDIVIGLYKGLTLTCVSQAEVDMEIATMLETYSELVAVDRAAEEGDTLNIDFVGKKDGVAFDGGTAEDYDLVLGSGTFIAGFEEGLIGAMAGEVRDLNLIFPENYGSAELAGQAVVFTVTVNAVMEKQVPDLTDEFIAQEFPGYATVAEYIEAMRNSLNMEAFYEQITEQLMASSEVIKYNEDDVELRKQSLIDLYTLQAEYYGSYYGLDTETSIQYFLGYESIAAFEEDMGVYAYDVEKNAMIIAEIADVEELEITEDVYSRKVAEMAAYYGYEDIAEFEDANGVDAIKESILSDLVMDFIIDNATITEAE
ncbi:MAG: FKBP-type peptidyl-prolyl cis-trans isomerase [Lachnospiraceae bacterium]|nr:FKBP-type peptidyl-prolyl cis-trans isomerase [Lachnospiraceae bacterium]